MKRTARLSLSGAVCLIGLSLGGPAIASEPCELLDIGCVLEGEEADAADDVAEAVSETLEPVTDATDPVVGPILDAVEDALGGEIVDPPTGGGGGGSHHTVGPGASGDGPRRTENDPPGRSATGRVPSTDAAVSIREGGVGPTIDISAKSGTRSGGTEDVAGGPGGIIGSAARGLLLVAVLLAIVLAFVTIQDRVDRNDPKLALAPIEPDIVRFE